jgi:hypothetical protein
VAVVRPQRQLGQQQQEHQKAQQQKEEEQQAAAGHNKEDGKSQSTAGRNLKDLISLYDFFDTDEECNNSVESSKGRKILKKKSPSSSGRVLKSSQAPVRSGPAKKFSEVFPSKATQSSPPTTAGKEEVSKADSAPEKSSTGSSQNADSRTADEMSHKSSLMPQRQQPQHYHYRSFSASDSQAESRLHSDSGVGSSCSSNSSVGSLAAMNASPAEERSASSRSSVSSAISSVDEHRTVDAAAIRHHELLAAENGGDRLRQQSLPPRRDRPVEQHLQSVGSTNNNRNVGVSASAAAAAAHISALHQYHAAAATAAQYQNLMMKQFEASAHRLHPQQQPNLPGPVFLPPSGQGLMLQQQQMHPKNLMLAREREMENRARYLR